MEQNFARDRILSLVRRIAFTYIKRGSLHREAAPAVGLGKRPSPRTMALYVAKSAVVLANHTCGDSDTDIAGHSRHRAQTCPARGWCNTL